MYKDLDQCKYCEGLVYQHYDQQWGACWVHELNQSVKLCSTPEPMNGRRNTNRFASQIKYNQVEQIIQHLLGMRRVQNTESKMRRMQPMTVIPANVGITGMKKHEQNNRIRKNSRTIQRTTSRRHLHQPKRKRLFTLRIHQRTRNQSQNHQSQNSRWKRIPNTKKRCNKPKRLGKQRRNLGKGNAGWNRKKRHALHRGRTSTTITLGNKKRVGWVAKN